MQRFHIIPDFEEQKREGGTEGEKVPYQQRDFSYYCFGTEQTETLPAKKV